MWVGKHRRASVQMKARDGGKRRGLVRFAAIDVELMYQRVGRPEHPRVGRSSTRAGAEMHTMQS